MASRIWFSENIVLESLNASNKNTMGEWLQIQYTEIGDDYLRATMPVNGRSHQPAGLLHGGASAALAEHVASMAGWLCVDPQKRTCVGMEINCNHLRGKMSGIVIATARPFHIGKTTQVWEIRITDEREKLVCISRMTLAVINMPQP
ncbi:MULTISPECIES: hotdog fold thioesterase [Chitinophagaceae]